MNKIALTRIIAWSAVVVVLTVILVMGLSGFPRQLNWFSWGLDFGGYSYQNSNRYTAGGASLDASAVSAIDVGWLSGSVDIEAYSGDTVTFSETAGSALAEKDRLHYYLDGGTLRIRFRAPARWGFNTRQRKHLSILVPEDLLLHGLDVESVSASVSIYGVDAKEVGVETVSGSATLSSVRGNALDLETVSGGVLVELSEFKRLDAGSVSGAIRAEGDFRSVFLSTVSGSLKVAPGAWVETIDAESVSGAVTVTLPADIPGFTADVESVSGGFTCDFAAKIFKNGAIYGDGSATLDFETVSGGVTIHSE